ncbi:hypothetical protein, partial [Tabrizicola sp.]|uniref:hypothetical protein n=1 Tax=Tabrizicola sp. TaxID=2005166 RepID=UPI003F380E5B
MAYWKENPFKVRPDASFQTAFPASSAVFGCRTGGAALTNQIALVLILVILAAIGLDLLANDGVAL